MQFRSVNPFDGRVLNEYKGSSPLEMIHRIEGAHQAYLKWKDTSWEVRSKLMLSASDELIKNRDIYSKSITSEMGKPIKEAIAEIEKCAKVCSYYAKKAEDFLADISLDTPHGNGYIHFNPLGVILAVMPWNFPFWQVFRFAAPAIMAGNTCLLKHSSNVPGCALNIEKVFLNAGFPEHIFNTLLLGSQGVQEIIEHKLVKAVSLTGSEHAGRSVGSAAGKSLKKTVLELGGSDPYIVLKDANIATAAAVAVKARMLNTGQSCIAAKRFILEKEIAQTFTDTFISELEKLKFGDPMDPTTDYGTLARQDLAEEVFQQVVKSLKMGAEVIYGELPEKINSAYFPPLILGNLKPGMPAFEEEIFGPVASFFVVKDEEEAVYMANKSEFGLGASLWTSNENGAKSLADEIETGAVYVNQMMFSDPTAPFGGIKKSGYGRELSYLGIREFTNQKTIWIR